MNFLDDIRNLGAELKKKKDVSSNDFFELAKKYKAKLYSINTAWTEYHYARRSLTDFSKDFDCYDYPKLSDEKFRDKIRKDVKKTKYLIYTHNDFWGMNNVEFFENGLRVFQFISKEYETTKD